MLKLHAKPVLAPVCQYSVHRAFATTCPTQGHRALVYSETGSPSTALRVLTHDTLSSPAPGTLNLRVLLSPINPSDVNVLQGVYPAKPTASKLPGISGDLFVAGNEGLAEVRALGSGTGEHGLAVGDWVIITKSQSGTWSSARNVHARDVIKVPRKTGVTEVHAATMTVNPPTAYNMLSEFVNLERGEWVLQNAANSAVGQAVIQIAKARGLRTLNLIRDRTGDDAIKARRDLENLGADKVWMYSELNDKMKVSKFKNDLHQPIRLALNCVGGETTKQMLKLLGMNAHLVSYGAMSKQPLSIPTSYFIFKNLTAHGFWQQKWYNDKSREDRIALLEKLTDIVASGKFKEPNHEIVTIRRNESDEHATRRIQELMADMEKGSPGRKILLKMEDTVD